MAPRLNGWYPPNHPLQILTWVLFPVVIIHYYAFLYALLWDYIAVKVIVTFIYSGAAIVAIVGASLASATDPADDAVIKKNTTGDLGSPWTAESIYCYECEVNIESSSKHCRICKKCVVKMDHHCHWLNTCVGAKNHK